MKMIRWIVGKILLIGNFLTFPSKGKRDPALQEKVNAELKSYRLYEFKACPFCVKVRRHLQRMNLEIELHDAKNDEKHRSDLLNGGGRVKVPCLRIINNENESQWMYESKDIMQHLSKNFPLN